MGEISTCFPRADIDKLSAVSCEILHLCTALRKFLVEGICKMKDELMSLSERVQAFTHELALSLRRIKGRNVEPDLPSVVHPADDQHEQALDVGAPNE